MEKQNPVFVSSIALITVSAVFGLICWGKSGPESIALAQAETQRKAGTIRGELVYVPIYSSIYYENGKSTMELSATLSIHNVNPDGPITILLADYYNTSGKLIKKHIEKPLVLSALETKNIVIDRNNTAGGTGANFLVEWQGPENTVSPMIEALMVNASSNLGIAFTSPGKVIRQKVIAN